MPVLNMLICTTPTFVISGGAFNFLVSTKLSLKLANLGLESYGITQGNLCSEGLWSLQKMFLNAVPVEVGTQDAMPNHFLVYFD